MFTRTYRVPDYGWEIVMFDPTIDELDRLSKAHDSRDLPAAYEVLAPLISFWNCTDRSGNALSKDAEGIAKLPRPVYLNLINSYIDTIIEAGKPKNPSAS